MIVEKQLLPNPALKPAYEKAVWLYVFSDFTKSEADRAAERVMHRLSVSSWPQLLLVDPDSFRILGHTGRKVDTFLPAVERAKVKEASSLAAHERLVRAEALAVKLEKGASLKLAKASLDHDDIVVRVRALAIVARRDGKSVVARATELLGVPNDPFRYEVLRVLKEAGDPKAARALEGLVENPTPSLNPNVLRMRAVEALATCGDKRSVAVIAPHAQSGAYFNRLTGASVDALAAIAKRDRKSRHVVRDALKKAYPRPAGPEDARAQRACTALAKRIHEALGDRRPFPTVYDERAREALMR